jgi:hypothetical protein
MSYNDERAEPHILPAAQETSRADAEDGAKPRPWVPKGRQGGFDEPIKDETQALARLEHYQRLLANVQSWEEAWKLASATEVLKKSLVGLTSARRSSPTRPSC